MPPKKNMAKEQTAKPKGNIVKASQETFDDTKQEKELKTTSKLKPSDGPEVMKRGRKAKETIEPAKEDSGNLELDTKDTDPPKRKPQKVVLGSKLAKQAKENSFVAQRLRSKGPKSANSMGEEHPDSANQLLNSTFLIEDDVTQLMAGMGISNETVLKKNAPKSKTKLPNASKEVVTVTNPERERKQPTVKGGKGVLETTAKLIEVENFDPNVTVPLNARRKIQVKNVVPSKEEAVGTVSPEDITVVDVKVKRRAKKEVAALEESSVLIDEMETTLLTKTRVKKNATKKDVRNDAREHEQLDRAQAPATGRSRKPVANKTNSKELENPKGKAKKPTVNGNSDEKKNVVQDFDPLKSLPEMHSKLKAREFVAREDFVQSAKGNAKGVDNRRGKAKKPTVQNVVESESDTSEELDPLIFLPATGNKSKAPEFEISEDAAQVETMDRPTVDPRLDASTIRKLIEENQETYEGADLSFQSTSYSPPNLASPNTAAMALLQKKGQLFRGPRGEYVINSNGYRLSIALPPVPKDKPSLKC